VFSDHELARLNKDGNILGLEDCDILNNDTEDDIDCCLSCYRFDICINSKHDTRVINRTIPVK